jgi:hypothetical protein
MYFALVLQNAGHKRTTSRILGATQSKSAKIGQLISSQKTAFCCERIGRLSVSFSQEFQTGPSRVRLSRFVGAFL